MPQQQRKYRNAAECAEVIAEVRRRLAELPTANVEALHQVSAAIERFADAVAKQQQSPRHFIEEGTAEVPDLGCCCEWSISTQRTKRPVLRLSRSPNLRPSPMSKKDLDAVLPPPVSTLPLGQQCDS